MALLFCDSFDHYTTLSQKWPVGSLSDFGMGAYGRNGTSGIKCGNNGNTGLRKVVAGTHASVVAGVAVRIDTVRGTGRHALLLLDGGTAQVYVSVNAAMKCEVVTAAGTFTGATTLLVGVYYYIELKSTIHNTTGSYELRINGVTELTGTNIDTQVSANAYVNEVGVNWSIGGNQHHDMSNDDLYFLNNSGATNNNFLGDVRIAALLPNGNGNYSQLVGSDANSVDNYLLVDENPPNDDTDYVESSTLNNMDTYAMGNLTGNIAAVRGVQTILRVRKDDAGIRSIGAVIRHSTTDSVGATKTLSTSYVTELEMHDTNPANAGAAWTVADVDAIQIGVKVVA